MDLGATLRQAREVQRLTREQLVRATRIPLRIIVAMEEDEWARVPGGIFARGYLRAYAHEVGLDGEALAARYDAEHAPPPEAKDGAEEARPQPAPGTWVVRWPILPPDTKRWLAGPGLVALLLIVYLAGRWSTLDGQRAAEQPTPQASAAGMPTNALGGHAADPVGTAAAPQLPSQAATIGRPSARTGPGDDVAAAHADVPLVVDVAVTRPCWVTASADGARTIYRILQPGERVQARGRVLTFRVGDAGALQLSFDGEPARPLGASGEVVTVRITRENYRSLLPARSGT